MFPVLRPLANSSPPPPQAALQAAREAQAASLAEARQAWALEKSALVKRQQEGLKELMAQHAALVGSLKRKLRRTEAAVDEARGEVTMLRVRLHEADGFSQELEAVRGGHSSLLSSLLSPSRAAGGR